MSRNTSTGVYSAPSSTWNPVVDGTVISSADWTALLADLSTALAHATATTRALYPTTAQVQDGALVWAGSTAGSSTAITATLAPAITAYTTGLQFRAKIGTSCGANPTLNVNSVGAKKVYIQTASGTPRQASTGDLIAGFMASFTYDSTLDSSAGGWIAEVAAPASGWIQISTTAVSGSPATEVDITIPSWATFIRVEWHACAPSGATAPLCARISEDGGSNYLTGGSDYGGIVMGIRSTGTTESAMSSGRLDLSAGILTSQTVDGYITMRRAIGAPADIQSWYIDDTPTRVRHVAYGGGGTAAPTNIRFYFPGTSVAVGSTFTLFARA